jgi:hypothetical protein
MNPSFKERKNIIKSLLLSYQVMKDLFLLEKSTIDKDDKEISFDLKDLVNHDVYTKARSNIVLVATALLKAWSEEDEEFLDLGDKDVEFISLLYDLRNITAKEHLYCDNSNCCSNKKDA